MIFYCENHTTGFCQVDRKNEIICKAAATVMVAAVLFGKYDARCNMALFVVEYIHGGEADERYDL